MAVQNVGDPPSVAMATAVPGEPAAGHGAIKGHAFWALTVGSVGVVFGDIGTSPIYAMREALAHARGGGSELAGLGGISPGFWGLMPIVTGKYVAGGMLGGKRGAGGTPGPFGL